MPQRQTRPHARTHAHTHCNCFFSVVLLSDCHLAFSPIGELIEMDTFDIVTYNYKHLVIQINMFILLNLVGTHTFKTCIHIVFQVLLYQ